ncbi:hypothetical protein BBJ28_00018403 [Nothophytophthora sp. Chile5]|nr:hypothetical protein BBJ28_00018403 [Nothophytophthora sp. Chile5]
MHSAVASGASVAAASARGALLRRPAEGQRRAGTSSKAGGTTPPGTNGHGSATVRRSGRLPKKRTVDAAQFEPLSGHSREGKMLKLALAKSMVETKLVRASALPRGAVFYPTRAQFADPIKYISSIEKEAARTGICKIVPPSGWKPPFAIDLEDESVHFGTRKQKIHELQEGHAYDDGRSHTFKSYRDNADAFRRQWFDARNLDPNKMSSEEIEQEYWRIVESGAPNVEVLQSLCLCTSCGK